MIVVQLERAWVFWLTVSLIAALWFLLRQLGVKTRKTAFLEIWEKALAASNVWERILAKLPTWSLLLSLGTLFFLGLAGAGPSYMQKGGGTYHLVLDASASMRALGSDGETRFAKAVAQAKHFLSERFPGDRVSLSVLEDRCRTLSAPSEDWTELIRRVDTLQVLPVESDFQNIRDQFAKVKDPVLVLSDSIGKNVQALRDWELCYLFNVGEPLANVGFVSFQLDDPWPKPSIRLQLGLHNFSSKDQEREIRLRLGDQVLKSVPVKLPAGANVVQEIRFDRGKEESLTIECLPFDAYSLDDLLSARVKAMSTAPIVLIRNGNSLDPFLQAAAEALSEEGNASIRILDGVEGIEPGAVVLSQGGEWQIPPDGNGRYLLFGAQIEGLSKLPWRENPKPQIPPPDSYFTRDLHFDWLRVSRALTVHVSGQSILSANDGPLLFQTQWGTNRIVASSFSLSDSNWPVLADFPVFVRRAYAWLLGDASSIPAHLQAGQILFLNPELGFWKTPMRLGPVQTPLGQSMINFQSETESDHSGALYLGWSKEIPQGPGFRKSLTMLCLVMALVILSLRAFLEWFSD